MTQSPSTFFSAMNAEYNFTNDRPATNAPTATGPDPNDDDDHELEFPSACLPSPYREIAEETARITQTPIVLAACCMLGLLSSAIGRGLKVESGPGRTTYGNLFLLLTAESGSGKSVIYGQIFAPFLSFEQQRQADWKKEVRPRLIAKKEVAERQLKQQRNKKEPHEPGFTVEDSIETIVRLIRKIEDIERELEANRLYTENVTVEKLAVLLEANGESLSLLSPDAREVVNNILGRNNQQKQIDDGIFLKAYSGDPCQIDRIGRASVTLNSPIMNVVLLLQPDKFAKLLMNDETRDGGLLPRFLGCHTNAEMEIETGTVKPINPDLLARYHKRVTELLQSFRIPGSKGTEVTITVEPEAAEILRKFRNDIVIRIKQGDFDGMKEFAARYAEQAWRLTVVLHAARWGAVDLPKRQAKEIDPKTAKDAVKIVEWFIEQQSQLLAGIRNDAQIDKDQKYLALLHKHPEGITARHLYHDAKIESNAANAKRGLDDRVRRGLLVSTTISTGGRPSTIYTAKLSS
jgi:hypothetical protein